MAAPIDAAVSYGTPTPCQPQPHGVDVGYPGAETVLLLLTALHLGLPSAPDMVLLQIYSFFCVTEKGSKDSVESFVQIHIASKKNPGVAESRVHISNPSTPLIL